MRYPHLLLLGLVVASPAFADEPIGFNREIRPILSDKCFFCHGPDGNKREANLRLDDRESAINSKAVIPGKPDDSELLKRVLSDDPDLQMPPPSSKLERLTPQEIETMRAWISGGAPFEAHWSFIPLTPNPPKTSDQHPIDSMIRAKLEKRGITPQPEADRTTLLRRVTFDLTGLPPTPDEVRNFLEDSSPNAYEKVVDRLLASEAYGERMAVDWLDSSRYADSFGFQVDRDWDMWAWRDWVIRAFNTNLPFDQFVTWQLAGDLLPNPTDDQRLATAFNRLHQQEAEGGSVEEEYRVEYVCDRVQTFATTFLGLTFECARCHDHKYDPITQKEYYQFFAIFQNIDEAGLYSYFTPSPPTPTFWMTDDATKKRLSDARQRVSDLERIAVDIDAKLIAKWTERRKGSNLKDLLAPFKERIQKREGEVANFSFEANEGGKLANSTDASKPAVLHGENKIAPAKIGNGITFTGDDPVDLPVGNFGRHQPFSVSLWMLTPDEKERAVVFHRSRAWTDAASRGYELLIEDGKLKWSLIHFWPGNAISIQAKEKLVPNRWTHVVVTYDGSSRASGLKLYVDGSFIETDTIKDKLTKEITGGGGDNIALGERFRDRGFKGGQIDEMRVYQRTLNTWEAKALFSSEFSPESLSEAELESYLVSFFRDWDEDRTKYLSDLEVARRESFQLADGIREIMAMEELPTPKRAFVLSRGEYNAPQDEVFAGTPKVLGSLPEGGPKNRLGLARWLTDPKHPLMARVNVNRFWQAIFGRGLVRTSEDFGNQGAKPLYPEVLDWLASDFIEKGWDTKLLVKTMVMSQTYRQRSVADEKTMTDDPDNEWLARGPRFRLPAEMIRDNALAAAGLLHLQIGGPPVDPYEMSESFKPSGPSGNEGVYRRSLYTHWRRTGPPPALLAFDAPRRAVCIAKRERTDSPLQALILLNGIQYVEAARVLGETLYRESSGDIDKMIDAGFVRCLSREAREREHIILKQLFEEQLKYYQSHEAEGAALLKVGNKARDESIPVAQSAAALMLAQAMLNHDECVVKR